MVYFLMRIFLDRDFGVMNFNVAGGRGSIFKILSTELRAGEEVNGWLGDTSATRPILIRVLWKL